jgi:glycerol-3-phosphate dehydrogenase
MAEETVNKAIHIARLNKVKCRTRELKLYQDKIHNLPIREQVSWFVRHAMARTVEDVLARRSRLLFLDARAAISAAPGIAHLMAEELGYDEQWENTQIKEFNTIANNYLL